MHNLSNDEISYKLKGILRSSMTNLFVNPVLKGFLHSSKGSSGLPFPLTIDKTLMSIKQVLSSRM